MHHKFFTFNVVFTSRVGRWVWELASGVVINDMRMKWWKIVGNFRLNERLLCNRHDMTIFRWYTKAELLFMDGRSERREQTRWQFIYSNVERKELFIHGDFFETIPLAAAVINGWMRNGTYLHRLHRLWVKFMGRKLFIQQIVLNFIVSEFFLKKIEKIFAFRSFRK